MTLLEYKEKLYTTPELVTFDETMETVDQHFDFSPTAFKNGETLNEAGQNNGSCKLFAFAKKEAFSAEQTLQAFGDFYRKDVLLNPDSDNHGNIRNFIKFGWEGVDFEGEALKEK